MTPSGFGVVTTAWSWPVPQTWQILVAAASIIGALIALVIPGAVRRGRKVGVGLVSAGLLALSATGYAFLPAGHSLAVTTHVIAEGTITHAQAKGGSIHLRVDTDPSWTLIVIGEDAERLAGATGLVRLQCEPARAAMGCTTTITGPVRPPLTPPWATSASTTSPLPKGFR